MKPQTYIEKSEYYTENKVFVLKNTKGRIVTGQIINLDTWKRNGTQMTKKRLQEQFEISPIQMNK